MHHFDISQPMDANNLIWDIQDAYHISDEESEEGAFDYGAD